VLSLWQAARAADEALSARIQAVLSQAPGEEPGVPGELPNGTTGTLAWLKVKQPKYREGERGWEVKK
jgi:hypothetical protein